MAHGVMLGQTLNTNNLLPLDGSRAMTGSLNMGNHRISNVATGTAGTDAVNLNQLNSVHISASQVTSGTFNVNRIPSLSTSKITSGTFSVSRGGTGLSSIADNRLIYGNGTSALSVLSFPSDNDSILTQDTSGAPYWQLLKDLFLSYSGTMSYNEGSTTVTYSNTNILADSVVFVSLRTSNTSVYNIVAGMNLYFRSQSAGSITFGVANPYDADYSIPITVVIAR